MSKHLKAIVKECRYLLEQELADRLHQGKFQDPGNTIKEPEISVEDTALAFLIELAILRCFEEQIWQIPPQLSTSSDYADILERLFLARKILQSEICVPLTYWDLSRITFSDPTLKTMLHHLIEAISPDEWRMENILGWIYQYFYDHTPEQKQQGKFYTPEPIAEYIVSQVFDAFWDDQTDVRNCTLLDLGCGSGVFALRAFERLYALYSQDGHHFQSGVHLNIPQQILENHLFLVDNDPWACQIAAINLYLKAKRVEPTCQIRKMNIFCADALQRWEAEIPRQTTVCLGNARRGDSPSDHCLPGRGRGGLKN